jgi:hypothetical protein
LAGAIARFQSARATAPGIVAILSVCGAGLHLVFEMRVKRERTPSLWLQECVRPGSWFPTHFTKNVKWMGTKLSYNIRENALNRLRNEACIQVKRPKSIPQGLKPTIFCGIYGSQG